MSIDVTSNKSGSYEWYDNAGENYGFSLMKVAALVKKYGLDKRRIWGNMAVDDGQWEELMRQLGHERVEGHRLASQH